MNELRRTQVLIGFFCLALIVYFVLLAVRHIRERPGLTVGIEPLLGL